MSNPWGVILAAACVLMYLGLPLKAQSAEQVLHAVEQKYQSLKTLSASFEQKYQNAEQVLEESGRMVIKKPGKMYWEYNRPTAKYFVVDGKKSWFYVPRDNQVIVTDIRGETSAPLLLLFGKGDPREDFLIEKETEEAPYDKGDWLIRLTPRTPQGEFSYVLLEVNPQSALIMRLSVVEPVGGRNDYLFHDIEENPRVSDSLFKLKLPSDVEIIEQ